MNSPDKYFCPKSDAYEKTLNGIDLSLQQNGSLVDDSRELQEKFHPLIKPKTKLAATGLWRKKRDIGALKLGR